MPLPTRSRRVQPHHVSSIEAESVVTDTLESQKMADAAYQDYAYVTMGIDPGTGTTGYGVVALSHDGTFDLLACGVIRTPPRTPMHLRLQELFNDLRDLIEEFRPHSVAVEKLFF